MIGHRDNRASVFAAILAGGFAGVMTGVMAGCSGPEQSADLAPAVLRAPAAATPESTQATMGRWVIADRSGTFDGGVELADSTISVTETGFDRITRIQRENRLIEVGESGSWSVEGPGLSLRPETVTVIVTRPGDVTAETFEPENDTATATLTLVGDRLVLEMLEAGRPVGRIAYRRDR